MNDIILNFSQLGFSLYEAKAYHALLQKHPSIGYEVSKMARIPSAKIYEVLNSLKNKGAAIASSSEPVLYSPVPPKTLLGHIRTDMTSLIDTLEKSMAQVQPLPDTDAVWRLKDYKSFMEKLREMAEKAKDALLISLWPEEAAAEKKTLQEAVKRGVRIFGGTFGECGLGSKNIVNLELCGASSRERLKKMLSVAVMDDREVLIGEIGEDRKAEGVWTTTPAIVLVAKEYIKHDIWGRALIDEIGEERFHELCKKSDLLTWLINNR